MNHLRFLDEVLKFTEEGTRSLDCVFAIELETIPAEEILQDGILKAQKAYPKTSRLAIPILKEKSLDEFMNRPLKDEWHLEEALIGNVLALKMSHVLGDALSMMLFLKTQLSGIISENDLELHRFPRKRDTPYRSKGISEVWPKGQVTSKREFLHFTLTHESIPGPYTLNDLLSLAILNSLPVKKKSLWVPVNVRRGPMSGFGNGLSRMRIYPPKENLSLPEQLAFIRQQKRESWKNGEIFLPEKEFKLNPANKLLLKTWINRPWADWGSISFSHLTDTDILPMAKKVWGLSNIPKKLTTGIFAYTHDGQTDFTLTYDRSVKSDDIKNLMNLIQENFARIKGSL